MVMKTGCFLMLWLQATLLWAQHYIAPADSSLSIPAVTITANRLQNLGIGNKTTKVDSAQLIFFAHQNLTDILNNETALFLRSYGLGSLATLSVRGTASTQTAILWNGFNLQSPMNTLYDLSLLPVFFLDDIAVQQGSAGALFGSGAVGGSIHLNNQEKFNQGFSIKYASSYGSFQTLSNALSIAYSNKKWFTQTRLFYKQAENDFTFQNLAKFGKPIERLTNAQLNQYGVLHEHSLNLKNKKAKANQNLLALKIWHQGNTRNIPPSMTMNKSIAQQKDGITRITASWHYHLFRWNTVFRNAYFKETILFKDENSSLDELYIAQTIISEWENNITLRPQHLLQIAANYTFNTANSENYAGTTPVQHRGALFASYKYHTKNQKFNGVASIRQEVINQQQVPITPSLGLHYQIIKPLQYKASISRNFKVPSFNDWYWNQGGNPNLLSEKGWGAETGFEVKLAKQYFSFTTEQTFFANTINNRIIWLPNEIGIWTPENLSKVNSKGIESNITLQYQKNYFSLTIKANYQWVKATNSSNAANKAEANKQLIYIPMHKGILQFIVSYRNTQWQYQHSFTGKAFVTSDNTKTLPPYHIANMILSQKVAFKNYAFNVLAKVNNLYNQSYQVIEWRAMPGRHYEIGLQFSFNYKNSKTNPL
jgi:vitamin B12 transporter